jgi:hypothetical protein
MRTTTKLLTTILTICLFNSPSQAQVSGGIVTGRVTDASGANIPNATIELENIDTGQRLTVTTDASGTYTFSNVTGGRYRIVTSGGSGATAPTQEISVDVSRTNTINISIPGGPRTDVQATTEAVPVTNKPASIQNVWNTRSAHYMPEPNFVDVNGQAYGAYNLSIFSEAATRKPNTTGVALAGQRPETNFFHVDGTDNLNRLSGGPLVYVSNEATTEFSLFQNQPTPLFGHTSGGQFNNIVRTGTNQAHGSVYNYLQNRWFNSVDRSMRAFGYNRDNHPRYDQNRLGGSLGVPIVPSKVFFFGNFEYIPLGFEAPMGGLMTAPTAAGLTALANNRAVSATNLGILRSALGTDAPVTQTQAATIGGATIPFGAFTPVQRHWRNSYNGTGSLDFNMNEKDQFRFRYVHNQSDATFFGNSAVQSPNHLRSLMASGAHYHTFGNMVTNELRFGYNRIDAEQYGQAAGPAVSIGDGTGLNFGATNRMPSGIVNTYHVADALSFTVGGHQLKVGFDGRRSQGFRDNFAAFGGSYAYSTLERFLLDLPPDVSAQRAFGNNRLDLSHWMFFGFVNDTWRASERVTLDLGVRYQYAKIPNAFRNQGLNSQSSVPGLVEFNDPRIQRWNFAPYVGIAVSPWTNRTVIRGSFGMWYDASYWQPFTMGFAPQLARVTTGSLTSNTPGFLAGGGLADPGENNPRAGVSSFIGDQEMPYSMQWNFAVQQALWENTSFEFKYLGNRGVHQPIWSRLNYAGVTESRSLPLFTAAPSQAQLNALPLTLNQLQAPAANSFTAAGFTNPINTINFGGNSWYHGAVVGLNHRFTGGLQVLANYTWSRWEDTGSGTPLDLGRPFGLRTWSMYDQRHQANVTGMFELGGLFRDAGFGSRFFADFNVSGSYQYAISPYLTPVTGVNSALDNNAFGTTSIVNPNGSAFAVSQLNPLRNAGGSVVAYQVANPNAQFFAGAPGVFSGFTGRGLPLEDLHNVNLAASKRFGVTERAAFEIRGEAYNLFNRSNVVGYSTRSMGPGMLPPLGMLPGTVDVNNFANLNLLPSNARMIQLALRVTF